MRLRFLDKHRPVCMYRFTATILAYIAFWLVATYLWYWFVFVGLSDYP